MSELIKSASASSTEGVHIILKTAKFIIISYVISFILLAALALLLVYTELPETLMNPLVLAITLFAALYSAYSSAKGVRNRGWLFGGLVGGVNIFLLNLLGILCFNGSLASKSALCMLGCGVLVGMVGGIFGVGMQDSKHIRFKN